MKEFTHLGVPSNQPTDTLDLIDWKGGPIVVRLECAEFTSLCPVTGQPDFATLTIEYIPDHYLAETKSVKLYLWRYRDQAVFNEVLIDQMAQNLFEQLKPRALEVTGRFHPRGGIAVVATAHRGVPLHL